MGTDDNNPPDWDTEMARIDWESIENISYVCRRARERLDRAIKDGQCDGKSPEWWEKFINILDEALGAMAEHAKKHGKI